MSTISLQLSYHPSAFSWSPSVPSTSSQNTSRPASLSPSQPCLVDYFLFKITDNSFFVSVLFTLYARVAQSLPSTSYIKMIEVWLLFHIIIPFFIFFVLFWEEHKPCPRVNVSHKNGATSFANMNQDCVNKFSTLCLPAIICIFVLIFFTACFIAY